MSARTRGVPGCTCSGLEMRRGRHALIIAASFTAICDPCHTSGIRAWGQRFPTQPCRS